VTVLEPLIVPLACDATICIRASSSRFTLSKSESL
jgi:hypothetical protein